MTLRTYAIGDIHGQIDLLRAAHARIAADRARVGDAEAPVVHIGDLVDRGPDSRGVVDLLLKGQLAGQNWVVLKGNHDRMFSLYLEGRADPKLRADLDYLNPRIGGIETLASYGVTAGASAAEAKAAVPAGHRAFLADLPGYFLRGEVLFVHAGIKPGVPLQAQVEDDLIWIRDPFLHFTGPHPWLVVHGHTHRPAAENLGNRVNIDSSAAYGGPLTAVVIEGREVFTLTDTGREPLLPAAG
jgi:Diadenosine tetraphosphatase and related serine/threonine protein phosphatases